MTLASEQTECVRSQVGPLNPPQPAPEALMRGRTLDAPEQADYLTISEAGRRLKLSPQRVQQLFDAGRLIGIRTPYGRLVSEASTEALAQARAQGAVPTNG